MHTLISALLAELRQQGVTLLSATPADAVERTAEGWHVTAGGTAHDAGLLVIAVEGPAAVGLLADTLPELAARRPDAGPDVSLVTLVVDQPQLDAAPRGTGVLVAPQSPGIQAKALTHATAKWGWLAARTGPGTHVLRLSYGRGEDPRTASSAGPCRSRAPTTSCSKPPSRTPPPCCPFPSPRGDVVDWDVVRWAGALPFASLGHKGRVAEVRSICAADGTLAVVGGWLSGNGLAAIVADTAGQVPPLLA